MMMFATTKPLYSFISLVYVSLDYAVQTTHSVPQLHASDLRQLSKSSHIARSLSSAPSTRQYAYPLSTSDEEPFEFAQSVSKKCQSRLVNVRPGHSYSGSEKSIVVVNMPGLAMEGSHRKDVMAEHGSSL